MSDERIFKIIESNDKYYILGFIQGIIANRDELLRENKELRNNRVELKKENDTLKKRIKAAIEYNQEDINQIKEFYKPTHEIIYSGDAIIDIAKITIAILKGKKNE